MLLGGGLSIPGWGNSFIKGEPDPDWLEVDEKLKLGWEKIYARVLDITERLHSHGKMIYPNPACYTAAAAIAFEIPIGMESRLFIEPRVSAWCDIIQGGKEFTWE